MLTPETNFYFNLSEQNETNHNCLFLMQAYVVHLEICFSKTYLF